MPRGRRGDASSVQRDERSNGRVGSADAHEHRARSHLHERSCSARALADDADASLSELAALTMTDRTSVKAVVDRLVAGGLVTKKTSPQDRRRAAVRITPKGRTVLRGAPRPPTALLVEGLEQLDPTDLRRLARGLRALTRAMQIDGERAGMLFEDEPEPAERGVKPPPLTSARGLVKGRGREGAS